MAEITEKLSGALADRYRIEKHLGEGGMATVYLARDLRHDRLVALKVMRPELAAVIGAERFLNEIKVTANLQHPHILPLHDSGDASGFLFYVMPYIEGDTLRDKLDRERQLGIEDAIAITKSIASALDYAHRQGVIHRDIKPANILLHDGQALVADFGIALAVTQASDQRLTETGLSIGTPHYMSPEQAVGDREVDSRSDIYSLAAMLYEMLAGEPPYGGSTAQAILAKILTAKAAPVSAERDTIPPHIDAAIAKALNRHPADRFATAAAFAEALTNVAFRLPTMATASATESSAHVPSGSRRSAALAGVAAVVVAAVAFFGGRATAPESSAPLARFILPPVEGSSYAARLCCGPQVALSPDGEWLAFVASDGTLYRRRIGRLEAEPVSVDEDARQPFFSPDNRWLGYYSNSSGRLLRAPMSGGPPVPIADVGQEGVDWGDGDVIVFVTRDRLLHTVPGAGGTPVPVPGTENEEFEHPWVLPGGRAALMTLRESSAADKRMVVVDLESGAVDTLGYGTRVTYASGHIVFSAADGALLAQPFDPRARETTGDQVALLDGVVGSGPGDFGEFGVSRDGGLVYQTGTANTEALMVGGPGASTPIPLTQDGNLEDPAFSPDDGRRIAVRFVGAGGETDVWIWDRDQETMDRLTVEGRVNGQPVWTPDGERIAFWSVREGQPPQVYWQPADGSGPAERLLETDYPTRPSSWSPDGQTLALDANRDGSNSDIGLLTLGESVPSWVVATEFRERQPQISPDGQWLAYSSDRSGELEVYVEAMSGEGGRVQVSTGGGHSPRWAPGGGILYYAQDSGQFSPIMAATFVAEPEFRVSDRSELFTVDDLNSTGSVNYDVSPDGEEFVHIEVGGAGSSHLVWIQNWPEIVREMTSSR